MANQPYLENCLSYIDALFDREHDRIHVVERRDGERRYQEYAANYVFYYEDPRGKFTSIFGTPVSRFSSKKQQGVPQGNPHTVGQEAV
jgi:hypothetical protein